MDILNQAKLKVVPVDQTNWRQVSRIQVEEYQQKFVAQPLFYLALCNYDKVWHPLAVCVDEQVIGMIMWAKDDTDGSCWLGGLMIDRNYQGCGYGKSAVLTIMDQLVEKFGFTEFALSYLPVNEYARELYKSIGFQLTGEMEDQEVVARFHRTAG